MNAKQVLLSILFLGVIFSLTAQTTTDVLKVHDTRNVNDGPNLLQSGIRADMKLDRTLGLPFGAFSTNLTISPWRDDSTGNVHQLNFNDGGIYYRAARFTASWGVWRKIPMLQLGTNNTETLTVKGTIHAREVQVTVNAGADYVFESDYKLKSLSEVKDFIITNKHLPEVPSEKEMQENGLKMNEFQIKLLQKVEELTLYTIQQQELIERMEQRILELESK